MVYTMMMQKISAIVASPTGRRIALCEKHRADSSLVKKILNSVELPVLLFKWHLNFEMRLWITLYRDLLDIQLSGPIV